MANPKKVQTSNATTRNANGVKQWNQEIQVTVSIDSIADLLGQAMNKDVAHRNIIVETIIDTMLESNKISYLYNSLCGFSNDINFKVDEQYYCADTRYMGGEYREIGNCVIKDINVYSNQKVCIDYIDDKGRAHTTWMEHTRLEAYRPVLVEAMPEPMDN